MHRLTIYSWGTGTGIRVQCTCRAKPIYLTNLPSVDFQTIIDAAVAHMDENPHPLLAAAKSDR